MTIMEQARQTPWIQRFRGRLGRAAPVTRTGPPVCPEKRTRPSWVASVLMALCMLVTVPSVARAVELHSDPCCAHSQGPTVVHHPVVYTPAPQVVHVSSPPQLVVENVTEVHVEDGPEVKAKKDLLTLIEARVGAGMWIIPGLHEDVHLGYNMDFSLAMRGFLLGLDFSWIHGMKWDSRQDGQTCVEAGNLALVGMKLGYRFNEKGRVHPELTARFDTLVLDRHKQGTVLAFGLGGSAGLVADFPLKYGAIVAGLEVAGHRHVWSQNGFYPPRASVAVMGSVGYKF